MHMKSIKITFLSLNLLALVACADDDSTMAVDAASEACQCSELSATDISFDPTGTDLSATTTQDALVEVASIATAPDLIDRIKVVEVTDTPTADGEDLSAWATCSGQEGEYLAIGGGCKINGSGSNLSALESGLDDNSMRCRWNRTGNNPTMVTARVICLRVDPTPTQDNP